MSPTGYTIPIGRVQAFVGLGLRQGWNVEEMLQRAGISPLLLAENRARVTDDQVAALVQALWSATDDELLGLGATSMPRGSFRMMIYALVSAPDLASALERYRQFSRALPAVPPAAVSTVGEELRISVDLSGLGGDPVDLLVDALLASLHRFIGWAIGRQIALHRVEVPYPRPPGVDDYDLIFGAPVVFDAPTAMLVCGTGVLTAPLVRSEAELEEFVRNAPGDLLSRRDYGTSVANQVRHMIKPGRGQRLPAMDEVAVRLSMSEQTVRRRLREEGTSLRDIRDQVLRDEAIAALTNGHETIAELADRLGFSEVSAFARAFRRWTGSPPGSYRSS
ncbi:AraC family transcriptional regulator [Mycobacterium yunnanensis]|nr:AraC family transcriptional regulator [Mycobacterium yunnanensis]